MFPRQPRSRRPRSLPRRLIFGQLASLAGLLCAAPLASQAEAARPLSPTAIVAARDGAKFFIACATADVVLVVDPRGATLQRITMPAPPSGLALSPDGLRLAVTCAAPQSTVCLVDTGRGAMEAQFSAGHTAMAPVFSADGGTLFVCNRFDNDVGVFDVKARKQLARIPVEREPVAAALAPDGTRLFVANHLHNTTADTSHVSAAVSVIDTGARRIVKTLSLPNGSGLLLGIAVSPDGRHAAVTHNLARFHLPTTQVDRGWTNTAGLSLIDATRLELISAVLLDGVESGAANPWALAWSADGQRVLVTHAGTHELSVIDFPGLLAKLDDLPEVLGGGQKPDHSRPSNVKADVPNDLGFLVGLRHRIKLQGNGPRSLALAGNAAWVPGYFSDSVDVIDFRVASAKPVSLALGPTVPMSAVRRGEMWFNDATLCFQGWQSCASCHSHDGRVDGLNWDLLNDGIGTPKNAKSLLWSHQTPPAMSTGVRATAEVAVRAGIRYSLFAVPPEDVPVSIDAYLKSLTPAPSPYLEKGGLSKSALRGKQLFEDERVGCAKCHPPGLFTDLQKYDVGTRRRVDRAGTDFDTPTLVELWRTGPYLHDGSARTIQEVLVQQNRNDKHGVTSGLTGRQINDLAAYLLSL